MDREQIQKLGFELVGQCGVDSGSMMFVDPCYVLNKKHYQELIDLREKEGWDHPVAFKQGIVAGTYMGDGNYHTYIQKDKDGRIERMLIDFTTTYGFDDENPEHHDIDMKELIEKVWAKAEEA